MYPAMNDICEHHLDGALAIYNKFVGSGRKQVCCLIPLILFPTSMDEFQLQFAMESACYVGAVAIWVKEEDVTEDEVVDSVHMVDVGMGHDLFAQWMHTLKEGKCYIETMCVVLKMPYRGIGIRLLEFCESHSSKRNARVLTLG
ncbi:hypothetical protein ACHAW6_002839 [Cyclotella cf. meneghiniana]